MPNASPEVLSYRALRLALGAVGFLLPLALVGGAALLDAAGGWPARPILLTSLSAYYHTPMESVFVGALCAIGVFLASYRGYPPAESVPRADSRLDAAWIRDRPVALACGFGALVVALVPTAPETPQEACAIGSALACLTGGVALGTYPLYEMIHFAGAALFLSLSAVFCLVLFRRTGSGGAPADGTRKAARNRIYTACGAAILVALAALLAYFLAPEAAKDWLARTLRWVALWESVGVFAFGLAWLVKSEALPFLAPDPG